MKGIDENGRLFGVVNVIDAVGALLIVALLVSASAVFVSISPAGGGAGSAGNESGENMSTETPGVNRTSMFVRVQLLNDAPYVVNGIDEGPVPGNEDIVAVLETTQTTPVETGNNTSSTASLRLRLNVTEQQGHTQFKDKKLYIGKEVRLDLGKVIVSAIVTDIEANRVMDERTQ